MKNFYFAATLLLSVTILLIAAWVLTNAISAKTQSPEETALSETRLPKPELPVLKIKGNGDSTDVYLQSLDIQVEVSGNIASTQFTMTFKNRTSKILEGELLFPLPEGVTVSSYALDINGKMRAAVPVEKAKATQVFEEIEHRRVDPGLLERVEGNNFRTRIYPVPANGTRTVSIGYEEELSVEKRLLYYRLPMDYKEAIENFSLKATVWKSREKPRIEGKLAEELLFDEQGENFVARFNRKNYQADRSLVFSLPVPADIPQAWIQPASGSYYFIASCLPKAATRKKQWGKQLGIIWDASLSGAQRNINKDLEALDMIIREKKDLTISLYLLNNRLVKAETFQIKNGRWDALRKALESVVYDGGSDFSAIRFNSLVSDEFLFFSDGLSTLSDADFIAASPDFVHHPVHCFVSSAKADYSSLKWIAAQTKGKFVNLNALSPEGLKTELLYETLHFLGIENNDRLREVYPSVSTPVQGYFSVAGIMEGEQTDLTLLFGYGNRTEKRMTVSLKTKEAMKQGNIYRIWAQKKINELDMRYEQNKEELTALGQQFGIVTRNTSLIVLETLQDYITYNIVPPAELQAEYFRRKKEQSESTLRRQQDFLNAATASSENLQQWWKKDFKGIKPKFPKPDGADRMRNQQELEESQIVSVASVAATVSEGVDIVDLEEHRVVVREDNSPPPSVFQERKLAGMDVSERSQAVMRIIPPKQDNDYFQQLTGKVEADYEIYLKLRANYLHTPTYYFDMADWFFKRNDREKAIRILTSITDIELENASLYRLLGYRLKEYKAYPLELYICRKVIQWRPMEPQSYRDYALALADNERYQEALDSLYAVITQSYAQNINQQSAGIEEVIVTEINRLIAKNPNLNVSAINKKLRHAMPVDIRVVINWNMNHTDIDLHVKDPHGETCFYSNRETSMGGRISRDITQGYGPEQFMLKKAVPGKYEVFVNYYGDSQVKLEGPSTIMVEIFTNYSGEKEERQVVCVQLSRENKQSSGGLSKVAEFQF
ncbi:MAG: DUF2135 domain-containing protein [Dysgonamonadaceae bacterium]|jgi:hypothetical protein|nr:DUF2135 domain-containing protein [Dysgonamonadaceae bacterium]